MNSKTPFEFLITEDLKALTGMHIVMIGNPFDGMTAYGPFKTGEDAHRWADSEVDDEWWALALHAPDENEEGDEQGGSTGVSVTV